MATQPRRNPAGAEAQCKVCQAPESVRSEIDDRLTLGVSLIAIVKEFKKTLPLSKSGLHRHRKHAAARNARMRSMLASKVKLAEQDWVAHLGRYYVLLQKLLAAVERGEAVNAGTQVKIMAEGRRFIETIIKAQGNGGGLVEVPADVDYTKMPIADLRREVALIAAVLQRREQEEAAPAVH